jgi:hypothetical protein
MEGARIGGEGVRNGGEPEMEKKVARDRRQPEKAPAWQFSGSHGCPLRPSFSPSSCEVLTSPLSTALTTVEIMEAGFTIIASVGHSLKGFQNNLMTHAQANAVPLCIVF